MLDAVCQAAILVLCMTGIILVNSSRTERQRYACVFGLLSEPFWFYTTIAHHQWGIFAATFVYTFAWSRGFYNQWVKASK